MTEKIPRILSYVSFNNRCVEQDGTIVCQNEEENAQSWLPLVYKNIGMEYPKFFKMDRLCKAGVLASELLMRKMPAIPDGSKRQGAVICFNSAGSLDDDRAYQQTIQHREAYFPSPSIFVYTLSNIVTGEIAILHRILGESASYVSPACDFKALASAMTKDLADPHHDFVLSGWIDYDEGNCDVRLFLAIRSDDESLCPVSQLAIRNE